MNHEACYSCENSSKIVQKGFAENTFWRLRVNVHDSQFIIILRFAYSPFLFGNDFQSAHHVGLLRGKPQKQATEAPSKVR